MIERGKVRHNGFVGDGGIVEREGPDKKAIAGYAGAHAPVMAQGPLALLARTEHEVLAAAQEIAGETGVTVVGVQADVTDTIP